LTREVNSEFGFVKSNIFLYQASLDSIKITGNIAFIFAYTDYPNIMSMSESEKSRFFENRRDGAIQNSNGRLLLEERISYKNYEGRRWRALLDNESNISNAYSYLVDNRFYLLQVISIREYDNNVNISKFLNSFSLFDAPKTKDVNESLLVDGYIEQGKASMKTKDFNKAINEFNLALEIDENNETALVSKAICFMSLGEWQSAFEPCDKAIQNNPGQAVAYFVRGSAKVNTGGDGCGDFLKSKELGFSQADNAYKKYCN
jgi:tetratricopeptide (TPR) repeat protein